MRVAKKVRQLMFAATACLSMFLLGTGTAQASGSTGYLPITSISSFVGGGSFLYTNGSWPNPDNCANPSRIAISTTAANYDLLMTMIYDAYVNGDTVNFTLSGCDTNGTQSNPHISTVTVQKS